MEGEIDEMERKGRKREGNEDTCKGGRDPEPKCSTQHLSNCS